ncbi:MAG: pyridoxine 5'-phosphate synthase [Holophagales bacterium]|nr:pyridoxine 5'-phosphate synthase [Holophagales bacterium]
MNRPLHLSVNIDHVATLRQARGAPYPDPVAAARLAEEAGAGGITAHLRGDRRHIQDDDVRRLRREVRGKLNVELAVEEEMLALAGEVRPGQVTLVPERPDEVTTEGGLDVRSAGPRLARACAHLSDLGTSVSIFLDPDLEQLEALAQLDRSHVPGFEINTDAYTKAALGGPSPELDLELGKVRETARRGAELGFQVYAGHGLTTANVGPIAALPEIEELNIGHWLVSRAVLVGMETSVTEMLHAMAVGRSS